VRGERYSLEPRHVKPDHAREHRRGPGGRFQDAVRAPPGRHHGAAVATHHGGVGVAAHRVHQLLCGSTRRAAGDDAGASGGAHPGADASHWAVGTVLALGGDGGGDVGLEVDLALTLNLKNLNLKTW